MITKDLPDKFHRLSVFIKNDDDSNDKFLSPYKGLTYLAKHPIRNKPH